MPQHLMACQLRLGSHHRAPGTLGRATLCPVVAAQPRIVLHRSFLASPGAGAAAGIWGALLQGATGRITLSALALARCRRLGAWRRELLQVSPGCGSLVSSPEGRAGSCHCGSLPVGFENCISNFCCYFKKILPKAVYITDTLSLQGMCGMAEALQNAVTVENVSGERKQTPSRWFYLALCRCVF